MKTILLILAFAAILASCSKQPDAYVLGTWKIEHQILATWSGLEKTNESITELHQAFMEFKEDGSGKLIHAATEIPFTYIVTVDEIILSSEIAGNPHGISSKILEAKWLLSTLIHPWLL
jgi:hypothetical protein